MGKNVQKRPKFVFKAKIIPLNAPSGRVSIAQIKAETPNFHVVQSKPATWGVQRDYFSFKNKIWSFLGCFWSHFTLQQPKKCLKTHHVRPKWQSLKVGSHTKSQLANPLTLAGVMVVLVRHGNSPKMGHFSSKLCVRSSIDRKND